MSSFNRKSRIRNVIMTSSVGGILNIIKLIISFLYRTVFIYFLSVEYLGLNGLFSNILQVLSLAELGMSNAIIYRFYKPISENDIKNVGMLMNYFKKVYTTIAVVIFTLGITLLPFIKFFIKDSEKIPGDVNIYLIYLLYLINSVSTYLFSYKLTMLYADQKNYIASIVGFICELIKYVFQILLLILTRNYTVTLVAGITVVLLVNYISSLWVSKKYKDVFDIKEMLPESERKLIINDTKACMCHKVGETVLLGTDSILLTKMGSLLATGIYSNYNILISAEQSFLGQILGNFTSSVGNALNEVNRDRFYQIYQKLNFLQLWIAVLFPLVTYAAIDDFINVWIGESYIFSKYITIIVCVQLHLSVSRSVNGAFINADGLFTKDVKRPLIEAVINLSVSIVLTMKIGIAGVFLGTIISTIATVVWREPLILYKYSFKRRVGEYWRLYFAFEGVFVFFLIAITIIKKYIIISSPDLLFVIIESVLSFIIINLFLLLFFGRTMEYNYYKELIITFLKKYIKNKNA